MSVPPIRLLHIDECPNWRRAEADLRAALDDLGLESVPIERVRVASEREAAAIDYPGSPTITVDGHDLFPMEGAAGVLACRLYPADHGWTGLPDPDDLRAALRTALGVDADAS